MMMIAFKTDFVLFVIVTKVNDLTSTPSVAIPKKLDKGKRKKKGMYSISMYRHIVVVCVSSSMYVCINDTHTSQEENGKLLLTFSTLVPTGNLGWITVVVSSLPCCWVSPPSPVV